MTPIEIAAVAVSLLSVYLTVRQNIWCWPVGVVGVTLYVFVFYGAKLYADMGLQVVYAALSFYGWYEWLYGGKNRSELHVTRATRQQLFLSLASGALFSGILGFVLRSLTDASLPWLDSTLTSFSLVAQYLMTRKYLQCWIVWIIVDVFYIGMFMYKDLHLTAVLYALFLILAARGYVEWKRSTVTA